MDSHTLIQALIYLGSAALIVPIAAALLARGGCDW
nr:Unknown Function [uncultured bacterium]